MARGLVHTRLDELGGIDLLAAVAGKQQAVEDITDLSSQQFDETYRTNVYAVFWCGRRCGQPPENLPQFGQQAPLGRAGQPAEMAPLYVFLASGESSYVVGETLSGTGGMPTP